MKTARLKTASPPRRDRHKELAQLFDADRPGWLEQSLELVKKKRFGDLDFQHLAKFLLYWAGRDKQEVRSRLISLLTNLIKFQFHTNGLTHRWEVAIVKQRLELETLLESPTLKNQALKILAKAYASAVEKAVQQTGIPRARFPRQCPYSLDFLLSDRWPKSH